MIKIELNFKHKKARLIVDWMEVVGMDELIEGGCQIYIGNVLNVVSVSESYDDIINLIPEELRPKKLPTDSPLKFIEDDFR